MVYRIISASSSLSYLSSASTALTDATQKLQRYKSMLNSSWQGDEMRYINQGIENTIQQIRSVTSRIGSLRTRVSSNANAYNNWVREMRRREREEEMNREE